MSKLYLIVTPIGNMNDTSLRAIDTLKDVTYIACENPSNSINLLKNFDIESKKIFQVNSINEEQTSSKVIAILKDGDDICYMSDAGFPCISDPGSTLVRKCIENNIEISVIGGNSAFLVGLIGSGLDTSNFTFIGFLSSKQGTIKNQLEKYKNNRESLIFYESSHRINETLHIMFEVFGSRKICIAKELTKIHENYIRTTLSNDLVLDENLSKGEFVLILEGNTSLGVDYNNLILDIDELISLGLKPSSAIEYVANKNNVSKNILYKKYHNK